MSSGVPLGGVPRPTQGPVGQRTGVWRAEVAQVDPDGGLSVTIARLIGGDLVPYCESAVFDPALVVGDRVWVAPIEGDPEQWAIIARRA